MDSTKAARTVRTTTGALNWCMFKAPLSEGPRLAPAAPTGTPPLLLEVEDALEEELVGLASGFTTRLIDDIRFKTPL